jgi:hypothetical protein
MFLFIATDFDVLWVRIYYVYYKNVNKILIL